MINTLTAVVAVFFGALGLAKLVAVAPMRAAAGHLGFTVNQYRGLGVLEVGGAAGVALGLVFPPLGVASAAALVLMMVGAVISHLKAGDSVQVAVPVATALIVAAYAIALVQG